MHTEPYIYIYIYTYIYTYIYIYILNRNPSPVQRRKLVSGVLKTIADEKRIAHAHSLSRQGVWTQWSDKAIPFDYSWKNIIYGPGEHLMKFVLHASVNWVRTPDLLRLWDYTNQATCKICEAPNCTIHHILSNCNVALKQKRYTWRHDSVNLHLLKALTELTISMNGKSVQAPSNIISFVQAGEKCKKCKSRTRKSLLEGTNDWKIGADFDHKQFSFPPEICSTDSRPDIVIWSLRLRKVILIELTCPAEEGIENASSRKQLRYADLKVIIQQNGWLPRLFAIEVGVRGFVAKSVRKCLLSLGMKNGEVNKLCKSVSLISEKCSYAIHCARESQFWDSKKPLLELNQNAAAVTKREKEASHELPSIDSTTKMQILQRKKIAESKLAISMKAKIAQKRKIAEAKLAKSMKKKINKKRERAKVRAKYNFSQKKEKKCKAILLEETSDHKSRIPPKMKEMIRKRRKIAEAKLEAKAEKRRITLRIERNRQQALIRRNKTLKKMPSEVQVGLLKSGKENVCQYPNSLPSVSSVNCISSSSSTQPVAKKVTWSDNCGGTLTDVHSYSLNLDEIQEKRITANEIRRTELN